MADVCRIPSCTFACFVDMICVHAHQNPLLVECDEGTSARSVEKSISAMAH